jgi:hypothetical protein
MYSFIVALLFSSLLQVSSINLRVSSFVALLNQTSVHFVSDISGAYSDTITVLSIFVFVFCACIGVYLGANRRRGCCDGEQPLLPQTAGATDK